MAMFHSRKDIGQDRLKVLNELRLRVVTQYFDSRISIYSILSITSNTDDSISFTKSFGI